MKLLLSFLLLLSSALLCASAQNLPSLPSKAKTVKGFVPNGWTLLKSASGDLNKDGVNDIAFVLESKDDMTIGSGDNEKVYQPRILGIALWNPTDKEFTLETQANDFILTNEGNVMMEQPLESMMIKSNTIRFYFHYLNSINTWYINDQTFVFHYQNGQFELVGYEKSSLHRASKQYVRLVTNFVTKKATLSIRESETLEEGIQYRDFKVDKFFTFKDIGRPDKFTGVKINFDDDDDSESQSEQQEESLIIKKSVKKARAKSPVEIDLYEEKAKNKK